MPKRVLVGYGVDADAVSGWLNTKTGAPANLTDVSRGIFGATVGIDRILNLFDKYQIKATFFIPAHTVESFPVGVGKIRDGGHEIGLHGYTHEHASALTPTQERDILTKSIQVITDFTGKKPRGWTGPHWETSPNTIRFLEEFGLEYDHSHMHHDSQLYYLPYPPERLVPTTMLVSASTWMKPMSTLKPSKIVEVPANWHLDDWPPLQLNLRQASTHGFVDPYVVERMWREQFDYCYREAGDEGSFVFVISIHPQVSGKPHVTLMHERLIEYINKHKGVEWCTLEEMVKEFKEGRMSGVKVEGGVEA
ncbi:glucose 1-dehydrogenase [Dendrothele bispora CBS 962.96]|uniref:Glucose 1-dehydrogenase n=1 Tax=Dendrothele bispora (strain CBS 962.96) TaxID=1314807 RepID=A0A4S8KMY2_DENBC|nr:glucose 1-dehydrogenase [Dendrothele bispora CBS 962.96]